MDVIIYSRIIPAPPLFLSMEHKHIFLRNVWFAESIFSSYDLCVIFQIYLCHTCEEIYIKFTENLLEA